MKVVGASMNNYIIRLFCERRLDVIGHVLYRCAWESVDDYSVLLVSHLPSVEFCDDRITHDDSGCFGRGLVDIEFACVVIVLGMTAASLLVVSICCFRCSSFGFRGLCLLWLVGSKRFLSI